MTITFAEFLRDPALSGGAFQAPTFRPWHVVAKVISGEALTRSEARLLRECTGLQRPPRNLNTLILLIGRRGGKSRFLSAFAVWCAVFARDWSAVLSPGERGVALLIGYDRKQATLLRRYASGICDSPVISDMEPRRTDVEIEFSNGTVIEVGTNDFRGVRGRTIIALIGDEVCFYATDGEGASSDEEVVGAAEAGMASVPGGGYMLLASSPWRPKGLMHKRWQRLVGRQDHADEDRALCWVAGSQTMNPALDPGYVKRKLAEDPVRYRCEFISDPANPWRSTDADFMPDDVIRGATDWSVRERPPEAGRRYFGFLDGASGTGEDSFTMGIAYREDGGRVVLAAMRERRPRFVPSQVVREYAALLKSYGLREAWGDRWSGGLIRDFFAKEGITYRPCRQNRSEIYLTGLPLLLNGTGRLLDSERLRTQLAGLERKAMPGGREAVNHGSGNYAHDDLCNAAIGALVVAADRNNFGFAAAGRSCLPGDMFARTSALSGSYGYA